MRRTRLSRALQGLEELALTRKHDPGARRAMFVLTTKPVPTDSEWRVACAIAYALASAKPVSREARRQLIEKVLDAEALYERP